MKLIPNYPNYSVTKDGNVINNKTNRELKRGIDSGGYCRVGLFNKGKVKFFLIHRLVASAFLNNLENKYEVNHIDGIKTNNNLLNLEWATRSENMKHAYKIGLCNTSLQATKLANSKIVLDTQNGIFYKSATEAATLLGIKRKTLCSYLSGYNTNKTSLIYA